MSQTQVIIGPFRRKIFAKGLTVLLSEEPSLRTHQVNNEKDLFKYLSEDSPTIVILESRSDDDDRAFLPLSTSVGVIYISQEGEDVLIALRQIDRKRLRSVINLIAEAPHPKVITLDTDAPTQPPFGMPSFREQGTSVLSWILSWLDMAFAVALDQFAEQRGGTQGAAWMEDLKYLRNSFVSEISVSDADSQRQFQKLLEAPILDAKLLRFFKLAPFELKLVCLVAAPDLDKRYALAIGLMQANYAESRPNATTLATMLGANYIGADIVALLEGHRLFARLGMIRPESDARAQPGYRIAPAIFDLMLGIRRRFGSDWRVQVQALPADQKLTSQITEVIQANISAVVLASGQDVNAGQEVAAAVIANGTHVVRANCTSVKSEEITDRIRDWILAAQIHDAALMLDGLEGLSKTLQHEMLSAEISGLVKILILIGDSLPVIQDAVHIQIEKPTAALLAKRWRAAGKDHGLSLTRKTAESLGSVLRLTMSDIDTVLCMAAGRRRTGSNVDAASLVWSAARQIAKTHAPETVHSPPCVFRWNDIVLPETLKSTIQTIPNHVRYRPRVLDEWKFSSRLPYGRGVGALFSGPSGTGKTMCAQVIASSLGVELMQVDIAPCVSKYIGETEKNIDRCFKAAEAASAVLLFDEADALFGKRTEIKDAHDRHANVEVAYLLQRIESYEGLVILTTNLKANIDPAFLRRLRFVCEFPMPNALDRQRIWDLAFPDAARCAKDVRTDFLAKRLPLSGGSIQAIAVNAAFAAAGDECTEISMSHITAATRTELVKHGMLSAEQALTEAAPSVLEGAIQ